MKKIIFIIILSFQFSYSTEYFISTTGSDSDNGLTEASAWKTIQKGLDIAIAGDVVWVKAGDYGGTINITKRNGTALEPIKIIGYKTIKGDIVSTNKPTYTKVMFDADLTVLDGDDMPILNYDRGVNNDPGTARAFTIEHSYVHFENLKIQYYEMGFQSTPYNTLYGCVFKNIIMNELGNWDPTNGGWDQPFSLPVPTGNLSGQGFYMVDVNDSFYLNCAVFNAGSAAFFPISSNNILIDGCEAYSTKTGNASDYLFDLVEVTNSTLSNYIAYRENLDPNKMHPSRAVFLQKYSNNNIIENGVHTNTRTQFSTFSNNNTLKNIVVNGSGGGNQGNIQIHGECNNNIFYNWVMKDTEGIQFLGEDDGRGEGDPLYSGNNNYFINFKISNVPIGSGYAIFSFHRLNFGQTDDAGTNYVINMTANDSPALLNQNRTGILNIYNSSFSNITNNRVFSTSGSAAEAIGVLNFYNCNFYNNGFTTPTGANITTHNPKFTNISTMDYTLQEGSALRDIGMNASVLNVNAELDFIGTSRPQGGVYDIGAYEYIVEDPTEPTEPSTAEKNQKLFYWRY